MSMVLRREEVIWAQTFHTPEREPVQIRLSIHARGADALTSDAYYLVTTGFFKILHDLQVVQYRHMLSEAGLTLFVDVQESRSVVRSYLQNLKNFHILGDAWDFVLVDGMRLSAIVGENGRGWLDAFELAQLAYRHTQMGSRPLRFSRYFLYAALRPFSRVRGYGAALMDREDAKGRVNFYHVLEALELLQRSFATLDFSGISSLQSLRAMGKPLEAALAQIGNQKGFFKGLLFQSLILAAVYEQKTSPALFVSKIQQLTVGIEKDFTGPAASDGIRMYRMYGVGGVREMVLMGMQPLLQILRTEEHPLRDLDDLTLRLFAQFQDTTTLSDLNPSQLAQVQHLAELALHGHGVDRYELDQFFYANGLVTNGVRDMIAVLQILAFMEDEE